MTETIVILDYGSQYTQLIARRVREAQVYSELLPWDAPEATVMAMAPKGFILSGGPSSVYDADAPTVPDYVIRSGLPILGDLLWHAAAHSCPRRQGGALGTAGIWPGHD